MRSPRPWCFSLPTTAVTSRERSCLWMAASHKCKAVTAAPEIAALLKDKGSPTRRRRCSRSSWWAVHLTLFFSPDGLKRGSVNGRFSPKQEKEKTMSSAMMRTMRAESFTGYGGLKLVEAPRPRRADGRVLVRITAAGVNPLDNTILSGGYPRATAPLILGNEGAGVVEDPGDSVFSEGARVMFAGPYGVF